MIYRPDVKPKSKKINLVLSGTGALYPAHAGAVCALIDQGYEFKAIAGTSGGAIIATALAGGTSRDRMKRMLIDFNPWPRLFKKFTSPFQKGWGFYNNKAAERMCDRLGGNIKFSELKIPIYIVATQILPSHERVVFNAETSPDLTLSQAARISSALPILFQSISYKGKTLIDGTFADNLYIEPFEDDFDNTIAINLNVKSVQRPRTFWEFVKLCLSMIQTGQGTGTYTPNNLTVIPIEICNYTTPLRFRLSRRDRANLFEAGYNAVMKHFAENY